MKKLLLFCYLFVVSTASGQSVNLTGPFSDTEVREGDDFATEILGNPWDFSQRRDVGWEELFNENSINVNGGAWQGTNQSTGSYLFPLFPGFTSTLEVDSLPGDKSTPKLGSLNRIDTNKYYYLSYRLNDSNRTSFAVFWESTPNKAQYWPDPTSPYIAASDGYYHSTGFTPNQGYNIYNINMRSPGTDIVRGAWTGDIYALRLDPSLSGPAGSNVSLDWMRVYDPSSAPYHTITWNASALDNTSVTTIWVDTNASGFDGTPIARYAYGSNPGTHSFPTAMLPPGDYYFYITVQNHFGSASFGPIQYSGYSAKLRINAKAEITITNPTTETGENYATTKVGNAWNMDSSADIPNLNTTLWPNVWRQFSNYSFTSDANSTDGGSVFAATADAPLPGNTESDVGVFLNISASKPINPNKYRYVTYRMWVDSAPYGNISDKVARGWVSRPFTYWNNNILQDGGYMKGHVIYEGWHTYTVDLWRDNILQSGVPYRSFQSLTKARLEVGEFDVATNFRVDFMKLTAENQPTNNNYQISYNITDPDSSAFSVDFYRDSNNSGFDGTYIGSSNAVNGTNTYNWDTTGLADGEYYVYLVVNDGVSTSKRYSSVHIRIGVVPDVQPRTSKAEMDYDGDGSTDLTVYRASSPGFHASQSSLGFRYVPWGGYGFTPIYGDFDGDGKSDFGLLQDTGVVTFTYIFYSSNDFLYIPELFDFSGGKPVIADYNGDGKDEVALYNTKTGEWNIRYENGTLEKKSWGSPGFQDQPTPGDYDGDKKTDLCVWRPASGQWLILQSSNNQYRAESWGSLTYRDIPMAADYDGDGKTDFGVFRVGRYTKANSRARVRKVDTGSGKWFIKSSATGLTSNYWATPGRTNLEHVVWTGDIPFVGDRNGDGKTDLMLFRPQTGYWYVDHRNSTAQARYLWGTKGDTLPRRIR